MLIRSCFVAAILLAAQCPPAAGHGYLVEPPSRNVFYPEMSGYCPHCGNGGSKQAPGSICGDGNQWPVGSNFVGTVRAPDRTYTAGSVVEFNVSMNVNHKGHHEFFICDRAINSDAGAVACFQKFPLMRVAPTEVYDDCVPNDPREDCQPIDPNYPGRWYHPPGKAFHKIHYRIPADLQCSHCTLLWFWPTANSQAYDTASYSCYKKYLATLGWAFDFCGWACSDSNCPVPYVQDADAPKAPDPTAGPGYEEFRNCADIAVIAGTSPSPMPTTAAPPAPPAPMPTLVPATVPPTAAPAPPPAPMPEPEPEPEPVHTPAPAPATQEPEPEPEPASSPAPAPATQEPEPEPEPEPAPAPAPGAPPPAPAPPLGATTCVATPGLNNGVTDAFCAQCAEGYQWWPCNFAGYCTCTDGAAATLARLPAAGNLRSRKHLRHHASSMALVQTGAATDHAGLVIDAADEL